MKNSGNREVQQRCWSTGKGIWESSARDGAQRREGAQREIPTKSPCKDVAAEDFSRQANLNDSAENDGFSLKIAFSQFRKPA
jgi:hypothetical protein